MKKIPQTNDALQDLIQLASDLRDKSGGCPWDQKQTYQSMIKNLIEESYEVADALERMKQPNEKNIDSLKDELGDLLFQIIFHCQLSKEQKYFEFSDVLINVTKKLVRRHPHVYDNTDLKLLNSQEVLKNWEKIKLQEKKNQNNNEGILDSVPNSMPALLKSYRMGEKVAKHGFDWPNEKEKLPLQLKEKITEEIGEFIKEVESLQTGGGLHAQEKMSMEFGDILFALCQMARKLDIDPEAALQESNSKFKSRFKFMENELKENLATGSEVALSTWEKSWAKAKQNLQD